MWVLLGFGEVNATLYEAVDWAAAELQVALFSPPDRNASEATSRRIEAAGIKILQDASLLAEAEVVLSAVSPAAAVTAAEAVAPYCPPGCFYVDLNSISGPSALEVGEVVARHGGRFVDGAIMGPVPLMRTKVPIVLSGSSAGSFQLLARSIGLNVSIISARIADASSLKMLWSVMTKGTIGLLAESLVAAHRLDLLPALGTLLEQEYGHTGSERMILRMLRSTTRSGARRIDEMRAARITLEQVEVPSHMVDSTLAWIDLLSQVSTAREANTVNEVVACISTWLEGEQRQQDAKSTRIA